MGNVLVVVKVYPEGPDEAEMVESGVKGIKSGSVKDVKRSPLAFGLDIIRAGILIPDKKEGAMGALEQELRSLRGVKDLEVEGVTLL